MSALGAVLAEDQTGAVKVTVSYGANSQVFDFSQGDTIRSITGNDYIRSMIGFQGTKDEIIRVNNQAVSLNYVLRNGDSVEFIRQAGDKG